MIETERFRTLTKFFICAVVYAIFAMTVSRELIIPHMAHSMDGHISGDSQYYHQLASSKAIEMRKEGILAFELRPAGQGSAGIASLVYFILENPYGVVFMNAFLHGISVVLMSLILLQWFPLRVSIIAALPLVISPYMMIWFSQLNKDSFALAGSLFFTYGCLRLISIKRDFHNTLCSLILCVLGILLMSIVRPYLNQILLPVSAVIFVIALLFRVKSASNRRSWIGFSASATCVLICLYMMGGGAASDKTIDGFRHLTSQNQGQRGAIAEKCIDSIDARHWQPARFVPNFVDGNLRAMMGQRCLIFTIIETHDNVATQNSFVDVDRFPSGALEALAYLPRAALLGVFAPWPDRWGYVLNHQFSFFYTIIPIETALFYGGLIGLALWIFRSLAWSALLPILLSVSVMTSYGAATPFIGALYRYRYPWWILLLCISLAALLKLATRKQMNK